MAPDWDFAGALQDHRRATLMGTRTAGFGSLRTMFPLGSGGGVLNLVTARVFTPSGRQHAEAHPSYIPPDPKDDKVLKAAMSAYAEWIAVRRIHPNHARTAAASRCGACAARFVLLHAVLGLRANRRQLRPRAE